jgi:hypothetical protein
MRTQVTTLFVCFLSVGYKDDSFFQSSYKSGIHKSGISSVLLVGGSETDGNPGRICMPISMHILSSKLEVGELGIM